MKNNVQEQLPIKLMHPKASRGHMSLNDIYNACLLLFMLVAASE